MDIPTARFLKMRMTQARLARKAGLHASRLNSIEKGLVTPRDDERGKIERVLGMPIEWAEDHRNE